MIIQFYIKSVYGVNKMYIADTKTAQLVTNLTNKKTIDQNDVETLTTLTGCAWVQVLESEVK